MTALRDALRRNLLVHTERAFRLLPALERPRILDLGCGRGLPSMLLAELSGGHVTALDRDRDALEVLRREVEARGLGERVVVQEGSVDHLPFPDESFDLVWCEGALFVLGFRESLRRWRRLLRPGGFLVAHDEVGDVTGKSAAAQEDGFRVLGSFLLSADVWWEAYYGPAQAVLAHALPSAPDPELADEVRRFREDPAPFRSAFFVLERLGQ